MHTLQPKHILMKEKEVKELLDRFKISRSQLPRIKLEDAALPVDVKKGDVVKIHRKDIQGNEVDYYRVIV